MKVKAVRWLIIFPAVFLTVSSAYASGVELIGFGSSAISMAEAYTAIGEEYPALYYNPAGMAFTKTRTLGLGYHYSQPEFKDVGGNIDIPLIRGIFAGFTTPLGTGKISRTVSVGLGLYDPTSYVIRVRSVNPQRPNYIFFENWANRISVLAGASFKALDVLSFGLGLEIVGGLTVRMTLDPTNAVEPMVVDSPLPPRVSVIASVMFRPLPCLSFGATFHDYIDVPIELPTQVMMFGTKIASFKAVFQDFYRPRNVAVGVAYFLRKWGRRIFTASLEAVWHQFSEYIPPVPQIKDVEPASLRDLVLASLNLPSDVKPGFKDIVEFKIGFEGWPLKYLGLRAGYNFRPSPVPEQKGDSNYLDSDVHAVTFGTSTKFKDPLGLLREPVSISLFFRTDILTKRTYHKDKSLTPSDNITFSGRLYTVGIGATYRF